MLPSFWKNVKTLADRGIRTLYLLVTWTSFDPSYVLCKLPTIVIWLTKSAHQRQCQEKEKKWLRVRSFFPFLEFFDGKE